MNSQTTSRPASRKQQSPDAQQPTSAKADEAPSRDATIIATSPLAWIAKLAKRLLAHSLNMPEPLLHDTGVFVFAHVQAVEDRALKNPLPVHTAAPVSRPPPQPRFLNIRVRREAARSALTHHVK